MRLSAMQQALIGKPVLMDPGALDSLLAADDCEMMPRPADAFAQRSGSIAIVQAHGVLMDNPGILDAMFGGSIGYQDVLAAMEEAAADDNVAAIVLDINSPGGEAAGMFPCMDGIRSLRGMKPMVALAGAQCASAGYGLASSCDAVFGHEASSVGSVGALVAHQDISRALDQAGIKFTIFRAGARKADGNKFEPLSDQAKAEIQGRVEQLRDLFVAKVAAMRGMEPAKLLAQESRSYTGQAAVSAGLLDGIRTRAQLLAELAGSDHTGSEEETMAGIPGTPAPKAAAQAATPDTMEAVMAAFPQAAAALRAVGATAERERIVALQELAKAGFEAELKDAIAKGLSVEAYSLAVLKAEKANPGRAMLAQLRKDGDLGVLGSAAVVETVTDGKKPKDETPKGKALAAFAKPEMQTKYAGNFGVFLYSEDAEKLLTRDEIMGARQALDMKGA